MKLVKEEGPKKKKKKTDPVGTLQREGGSALFPRVIGKKREPEEERKGRKGESLPKNHECDSHSRC